ncbi:MAG: 30S ribosome-binding factor RbfA [Armatimonadetes bacterium]|nr:30S ribosome-binding factor RbfA [Armatimonadota bacterium]MDI9585102.1 30S ribosome-binding factor RbfA [Acidobacteriota bacterium]
MPTQRQLRVNRLLQEEIADIMRRELQDPLIGFATVTGVEVTADLKHAKVFVSVLGDEESKQSTMKALRRGHKYIRAVLADRITLKSIPELNFRLDETAERAQRIEILLRQSAEELADSDESEPEE